MKLYKDFREFIELLNSEGVKYVLVGGYAVAFHGRPRVTGDVDFFIEASGANSRKMERVVHKFGFADTGLTAADFAKAGQIVQLGMPPCRIDIVTAIDGVDFAEAWASRVPASLDGVPVSFISKELLLKNKAAAGRAQDLADIEGLTADESG